MHIWDFTSKLPKIELHCHLDGSVRPETVLEIANKEHILLPSKNILELEKHLKVQDQCTSLKDYLEKFDLVLKVMQKPEYLYRITLELLEDSYINELYTERIGHGVYAFRDEATIKLLKDKNIALEMCVTSNVHTKAVENFKSHPIKQYLDKGIKVTVNADNNTVSNTNLIKEYEILIKHQRFTIDDLKTIVFNGIDASFAEEHEKDYLKSICEKEFFTLGY